MRAAATAGPLVVPDQSRDGNHARNDRPGCNPGNQNEEEKFCDIIAWCFGSKEFSAQFAEVLQLARGRRFLRRGGIGWRYTRLILIIGERKTSLLPLVATDLSCWFHNFKKLFSNSVRDDGAKNPRLLARPLGCPEDIRGLQLGEEQAPLISLPDSRRPEMAYASYSLGLLTAGRRFFQTPSYQIHRKCLIHKGKLALFIFGERPLNRSNLLCPQSLHWVDQRGAISRKKTCQ
jgi:hypothetical protein